MQSYHLTDEFSDQAAEQAILTSLAHSPGLYWELLDLLVKFFRSRYLAGSRPRVGDRPVS